jgi:hypothetical protein
VGRQGRGGLVHDEHADVQRDGLGDLDRLPGGDRQAAGGHARIDVHAEARQDVRRLVAHTPPVHHPAQVAVADEDVPGDAEVGEDQRFLEDRGDAPGLGVGGAAQPHALAVDEDLTAVGRVHAGHDLDQRRLAGAVLADEGVHIARQEVEPHVVQLRVAPNVLEMPRMASTGATGSRPSLPSSL